MANMKMKKWIVRQLRNTNDSRIEKFGGLTAECENSGNGSYSLQIKYYGLPIWLDYNTILNSGREWADSYGETKFIPFPPMDKADADVAKIMMIYKNRYC